ncbi:MAG TPA: alkaline phosphatase family protein [Vicinamibacteria bacterium]|nr:alkaline phosphatase family protein [Vicinamibacteria bacterium]HRB13388.1 alkaline phosphatase family protein [Vicinamibacteria bacterium]
MKNALLVPVLVLALARAGSGQAERPGAPPVSGSRLVVVVSVDQMRYDYLVRFKSLFQGGLKTLIDRGAVFSNARYRHANCETGPGHSVILSGRNAWQSGIVANSWFDLSLGRTVNVVDDPTVRPVGGEGRGASPANFIGFTLGDMLKKASPDAKVVGVAMKDRAAILMAGPRGDAAYWYEQATGRFITSTYYTKTAPPWLDAINTRRVPDSWAGKAWTRLLDDASLYLKYAGEDNVPNEADTKNTTFPHALPAGPPALYDSFRRTPFMDELTLEVALGAMNAHALGEDAVPDVLAVGFSATDVIGHAFGPDSHEIMDQMLRLDLMLKRLLDAAEAKAGAGRVLVVLASDHSVMPLVESLQKQGLPARRVSPSALQAAGMTAIEKRFPRAKDLIASYLAPDFYLNLDSIARQGLRRMDVEQTLADALLATGDVAKVYTASSFAGDIPALSEDPYFDTIRRSYFAPRSPHVIARLKEYTYLTAYPGGTGHGSSYEYDRHVPVVFMGSQVRAGTYEGEAAPEDIAPTLGLLLGIDYPLQDARRRLTEMIQH